MVTFRGKLTPTPRGGGGTLVPVPPEVATRLKLRGMPKIQAVIAGRPYRGSLMPMGDGTYCLGVLKSIQEAVGVGPGDTITIELQLDTGPRTVVMPTELASALVHDRRATSAWEALSYTNKKEMARSIEEAKKPETRARRVAQAVDRLRR
jgi:hypothetical protein